MNRVRLIVIAPFAMLGAAAADAHPRSDAHERLHRAVDRAVHADGPFLLPAEQALVARKCGYGAGEWDGRDFSMTNGILRCANGRRVDDPEVRAMMTAAAPRISRRVRAAMATREVREALREVSQQATARAMARLGREGRVRRTWN